MKRFRRWRSVALIVVLVGAVFGGWYYSNQAIRATQPQAWSDWRDKIQTAVTEYMDDNDGSPPILGGGAVIVDGEQQSIIDICALAALKLLPSVMAGCVSLPGPDNDNCDGGGCDTCKESNHYIWTVDSEGIVHSVCMGQRCDKAESDGYQGVWP